MLPHASAGAHIHIGTIAGKLNGVMPGDDAERLADRVDVDAGRGLLASCRPSGACGMPQQNSITSSPRVDLAHRVREHLAVLGASGCCAISSRCAWKSSRIAKKSSARLRERQRAPRREAPACAAWTARSTSSTRREVDGARLLAGRRVEDRAGPARLPRVRRSRDPVVDRLDGCGCVDDVGHSRSSSRGHGERSAVA